MINCPMALVGDEMDLSWRLDLLGGLRATQGDRVIGPFRSQKTGVLLEEKVGKVILDSNRIDAEQTLADHRVSKD